MKAVKVEAAKVDLVGIPMKHVNVFDLSVTTDGRVPFIEALKQVLRFCCVDGNLEITHELNPTELRDRMDEKERDRLSKLEKSKSRMLALDNTPLVRLTQDVAASKLQ